MEKGGGAWCPRSAIEHNVREWLEINLHTPHLVTGSETQGRFGNGQGQEFTEAFTVEYYRHALGRWVTYKNAKGNQVKRKLSQVNSINIKFLKKSKIEFYE